MLWETAQLIERRVATLAVLYRRAATRVELLQEALQSAASEYIGPDAHSAEGRLRRYLRRLGEAFDPLAN